MTLLPVLKWPNRLLGIAADPVVTKDWDGPDIKELVQHMAETMYAGHGIGLAAPQVGIMYRVFVIDVSSETGTPHTSLRAFVNPRIVWSSDGEVVMKEGCLSFPGIFDMVKRPESIVVQAHTPSGVEFETKASGILARAILHEYDHLDGIVFTRRMPLIARRTAERKAQRRTKASGHVESRRAGRSE